MQQLPSYFMRTHYKVPTPQGVQEFKDYQRLTKKQILQGVGYNEVGKGKQSFETDKLKMQIIQTLIDAYLNNQIYRQVYNQLSKKTKENLND